MQVWILLFTSPETSRLTTMPKWRKAGLTIMPWALCRQTCQNHLEDAY